MGPLRPMHSLVQTASAARRSRFPHQVQLLPALPLPRPQPLLLEAIQQRSNLALSTRLTKVELPILLSVLRRHPLSFLPIRTQVGGMVESQKNMRTIYIISNNRQPIAIPFSVSRSRMCIQLSWLLQVDGPRSIPVPKQALQ